LLVGEGLAVAIGSAAVDYPTLATAAPWRAWWSCRSSCCCGASRASGSRSERHRSSPSTTSASFRLGRQEIERFTAGTAIGVLVELRNGSTVRLSAVQRPNLAAWLGAPTEADDAIRELNRWLYRLR
jgi:hypothetical protein